MHINVIVKDIPNFNIVTTYFQKSPSTLIAIAKVIHIFILLQKLPSILTYTIMKVITYFIS